MSSMNRETGNSKMGSLRLFVWRLRLLLTQPKRVLARFRVSGTEYVRIFPNEIAKYCPLPDLILEAGAADGTDTVILAAQFPNSRILAVEPVPQALGQCKARVYGNKRVIAIEGALSDTSGVAQLHLSSERATHSADSSSLLSPSAHKTFFPKTDFSQELSVRTFTIDELIESLGLHPPDVMWLDMQGMEKRVLKGSPKALAQVRVVVTEASRVPLYEGSPTYSELKRFFRDAGFKLGIDRVGAISGNVLFYRQDLP